MRGVLILTALVAAATPATAQTDPAAQQKVMRFVRDFAGALSVADATITMTFVDLNADGVEEALTLIESPSFCGSRGCSAFALDLTGPEARSIGDFTAFELGALPSVTNGWHDVTLGGGSRFAYDGAAYRSTGG